MQYLFSKTTELEPMWSLVHSTLSFFRLYYSACYYPYWNHLFKFTPSFLCIQLQRALFFLLYLQGKHLCYQCHTTPSLLLIIKSIMLTMILGKCTLGTLTTNILGHGIFTKIWRWKTPCHGVHRTPWYLLPFKIYWCNMSWFLTKVTHNISLLPP